MWLIASRLLAGLGIGEVLNFLSPKSNNNNSTAEAVNGIMKLLIVIIMAVGGLFAFQFFKKKR